MKSIETVDLEKLKEACKLLNEHVKEPIPVVDTPKEELIKLFSAGVESLTEEQQDGLPDTVADFYNDLYADEAEGQTEPERKEPEGAEKTEEEGQQAGEGEGEKKEGEGEGEKDKKDKKDTKAGKGGSKKKKKKAAKKPAKPKEPKKEIPKDEFGFQIGSKNHMFAQAIKKKPMTMKEVRDLDWNTSRNTHYDAYNKMKRNGQADRDKEGKMFVVEKKS